MCVTKCIFVFECEHVCRGESCLGQKRRMPLFLQSISSFFFFFLEKIYSYIKSIVSHTVDPWKRTKNTAPIEVCRKNTITPDSSITDGLTDTAYFRCFKKPRAIAVRYYYETVHCNPSKRNIKSPLQRLASGTLWSIILFDMQVIQFLAMM